MIIEIGNAKIYTGDVIECLKKMPDNSVHCCITSPPYWGLRDYKCGEWAGGDPDCDHIKPFKPRSDRPNKTDCGIGKGGDYHDEQTLAQHRYVDKCDKCGAIYDQNNMIGLEPTFQEWLDKMVAVSAELWRVLRDDGTYWLNCGDAYATSPAGNFSKDMPLPRTDIAYRENVQDKLKDKSFKPKDLLMMPARLAIALHENGWYVRSEIIWAKPNPMPESVRDRPTSSHEKIYLLTKKPRYYMDMDAVREKNAVDCKSRPKFGGNKADGYGNPVYSGNEYEQNPAGRNQRNVWKINDPNNNEVIIQMRVKRKDLKKYGFKLDAMPNVWNIATKPYADAHFATFPPEIPRRCIMAGTSERGCCPECGNQWERVVEKENIPTRGNSTVGPGYRELTKSGDTNWGDSEFSPGIQNITTTGWKPTCDHDHEPAPSTVLDIFAGSGTTLEVALSLNRMAIGIELNPEYVELMKERIMKEATQEKLF